MPRILAIETSCDDTAAAVLSQGRLLSSVVSSQNIHDRFGGIVPELASRDHQRLIVPVVEDALARADVSREQIDVIAVTYGPGLAGSLLVGLSFAKGLAAGLQKPLIGVNHLEGHIYSVFLEENVPEFPYLCLTVSGGHTQLTVVREGFRHELLGQTRDDAAGEAFDKVAKLLGLGFPGGPEIDRLAESGDPAFVDFPRSRPDRYSFSFSGIKTSMLYYLNRFSKDEREEHLSKHLSDLAASFQRAVVDVLAEAVSEAVLETDIRRVAITGGVSANRELGARIRQICRDLGAAAYIPRPTFCTDNAAMIGVAAHMKFRAGVRHELDLAAQPNLTL